MIEAPESNVETTVETTPESDSTVLVIISKVKAYAKEVDPSIRVAGDVAELLTEQVKYLIQRAIARARQNGRGTMQGKDV